MVRVRKVCLLGLLVAVLLTVSSGVQAFAQEKIRVGVLQFESKVDGVTQKQADIIMDLLTRELASSKSISVYERAQLKEAVGNEVKLGMSGLVDPSTAAQVGKVAGVQYILLGAVTELSEKASGGAIPLFGGVGIATGSEEALTTIDVRLIDTSTSQICLALSETGHSSNQATGVMIGGAILAEGTFDGLQSRAIADAVKRVAYRIRDVMTGESSHVIEVRDKEAVIDIGSTMGAKEGSLYMVYAEGKTLLDMDNQPIGRERLPLALLKIKDISGNFSTCTFVKGSKTELVQRGDKIEPISSGNAKKLTYASSRPAQSSQTFDELFGQNPSNAAAQPGAGSAGEKPAVGEKPATADKPVDKPAPQKPDSGKKADGFDPNTSTEFQVLETLSLESGERNLLGIAHRSGYNAYKNGSYKKAYESFVKAAEVAPQVNYLSAYWAGVTAQKLKKNEEALSWIDKALSINPDYKPAQDFKTKTLKK